MGRQSLSVSEMRARLSEHFKHTEHLSITEVRSWYDKHIKSQGL